MVPALSGSEAIIGATVATFFALLQWHGIVLGSNVQSLTSLLKALAVVYGIEPMIILKDICGATDRETEAVVRWMMDALVDAALRENK